MGTILRYKEFLRSYKTRGYRLNHLKKFEKMFPVKSSPLLAGIVGDLMGDGHLQGDPKWRIDFTSKEQSDLKSFENRFKRLFGVGGKIRKCTSNQYSNSFNLGINCAPVARILSKIGVPSGEKVLQNFEIPLWIKSEKECFREFCRQFFTCEGTIMHEEKRKSPQIRLENWKSESLTRPNKLIEELCFYLEDYFKIRTTVSSPSAKCCRKDKVITRPTRIYILGDSVKLFSNEIGFSNWKQERLEP